MKRKQMIRLAEDAELQRSKSEIQRQSRELVSSGKLSQTDLFLMRRDRVRRAIVSLKP